MMLDVLDASFHIHIERQEREDPACLIKALFDQGRRTRAKVRLGAELPQGVEELDRNPGHSSSIKLLHLVVRQPASYSNAVAARFKLAIWASIAA